MNVIKFDISSYELQHSIIVDCKNKVELYFFEFCKELKKMHDSKLYKIAGYSTFEDYTSKNFDIKKTQAYECLAYAKKRSKEFTVENGKIGITKLLLLNSLSDEEATEFLKNHDVENITTKEIKRTLISLKDKKDLEPLNDSPTIEIEHEQDVSSLNTFGSFLKAKRLDAGLSIVSLAKMIGISKTHYYYVEADVRLPSCHKEFYTSLIEALKLNDSEIDLMYKLANEKLLKVNKVIDNVSSILANSELYYILTKINVSNLDEIVSKLKKLIM